MRTPEYSTQFRRDVRRAEKRGKDMSKLKKLLSSLIAGEALPPKYKGHPLKQNWLGYRDAHIEPDWVLIYALAEDSGGPIVRFERTGTHTDLFDLPNPRIELYLLSFLTVLTSVLWKTTISDYYIIIDLKALLLNYIGRNFALSALNN